MAQPLITEMHVCCVFVYVMEGLQQNKRRSRDFKTGAFNVPLVMIGTLFSPFKPPLEALLKVREARLS